MKLCRKCNEEKPISDFYPQGKHKTSWCKGCILEFRRNEYHANKEKYQKQARRYRLENPQAKRNTKLKQAYGIGIQEYERILKEQGGVCAGCKKAVVWVRCGKTMPMNIDHCHKTNQIRGILCLHCNRGLGCAKDDIEILQRWIDYLRKYQK